MKTPDAYDAYISTQNEIYGRMQATSEKIGVTEGILHDAGTDPQAAFLVAWRHPEHINQKVEELSTALSALYNTVGYGRHNAHTTLSDYGLKNGLVIDAENPDHASILDHLTKAVRNGLDATPKDIIAGRGISFGDVISNQKAVLALGQPTVANWQITEAVKRASGETDATLKGTWGNHMTLTRFIDDATVAESVLLSDRLHTTLPFGDSVPTAIEVGHFQTDPVKGFVYTTHERFEFK